MRQVQSILSCRDVAGYAVQWLVQALGWATGVASVGPELLVRAAAAAIALVLRNLWVWLHGMFLAERTAQGRRLHLERLRLRKLTRWLICALDEILGVRAEVVTT